MNIEKIFVSMRKLLDITKKLLSEKGCPWDIKQTPESMTKHLIEETYELIDSIEKEKKCQIKEELGDLIFLIFFTAIKIESKYGIKPENAIEGISKKLIGRHPHVFSDLKVNGEEDVLKNWEDIKLGEKKNKKTLDGIPGSLPALLKSYRIQEKVSRVGFDWDDKGDIFDKLNEELQELKETMGKENEEERINEYGDILFTIVNIARHYNIDSENALQRTNEKFIERFTKVEKILEKEGKKLKELEISDLEKYWQRSKK